MPKKTNYCLNFLLAIYNYFLKIRIPSSNYNIIKNVPLDFVVVTNIQKHRKLREKRMRYNTHNNSRAEQIFKELTCHDSVEISRNCLKRLMLEMREWRAPHHILFTTHTHAVL